MPLNDDDDIRALFAKQQLTVPELVDGVGPFDWFLAGFRAAELAGKNNTAVVLDAVETGLLGLSDALTDDERYVLDRVRVELG